MTDRELLEAAARAMGELILRSGDEGLWITGGAGRFWNPLTDDGDALRLAVKLGMTLMVNPESHEVIAVFFDGITAKEPCEHGEDTASVRRAIVRCAALAAAKIAQEQTP